MKPLAGFALVNNFANTSMQAQQHETEQANHYLLVQQQQES